MLMAGMYDYSGQWAFDIGVPGKSGVGGCVYIVIPNLCGVAIWSPRLDKVGNSARGVAVSKALVKRLQFHTCVTPPAPFIFACLFVCLSVHQQFKYLFVVLVFFCSC
jgi:hypothetical protein